jgi:hypothetical protein
VADGVDDAELRRWATIDRRVGWLVVAGSTAAAVGLVWWPPAFVVALLAAVVTFMLTVTTWPEYAGAPAPDVRAVEARWLRRNAEARVAGCRCGRPAQVVTYQRGNVGRVPVEVWTCAEHQGAAGWRGQEPFYAHPTCCPSGEVIGCGGPIGGEPTHFHCPHRRHETVAESPVSGHTEEGR